MARLSRKNNKLFCENAQQSDVGQFGSLNAGTKVETTNIDTIQSLPAWQDGWQAATLGNNCYPTRQERNGLDYVQSYLLNYLYQEGIPEWSANTTYYKGSIIKLINGTDIQLYKSLKDNNTAALSDNTAWEEFGYVLKTGDTMTGQLAFDKSLNGYALFNINDIPLKTQMDCITNANNLPVANVYGNGRVCVDNNGDYCYREYDRWSTTGQYLKQWIATCRDANNVAQNATLALSVNTAGRTTFAFPMCDTNPTTVSSASNNKVAVVVENYLNGTDWYRVWSDGFIEQGGEVTILASSDYGAISFLKTFSNTNYTLVATSATSYIITTATVIRNIAKTGCRLYIPNLTTGDVPTKWYACGY